MYVLIYMDDTIITGDSVTKIDAFIHWLHIESISLFFLGIEVVQLNGGRLHLN